MSVKLKSKLQGLVNGKQYVINKVNSKASSSLSVNSKWKDIGDTIEGIETASVVNTQEKIVTPSKSTQEITPDSNYYLSKVTVNPIPDEYIVPSGSMNIAENGTYNIANKAEVVVNIESSGNGESTLKKLLDATKTCYHLFYNLKLTDVSDLMSYSDTENVTNMSSMFSNCSKLTTVPQLNTGKVRDMSSMFSGCRELTTIPQLNTSNVTRMDSMFINCNKLTTIPQLNTSNVTNMSSMFSNCSSLIVVPQLNTSKASNMSSMFNNCGNLTVVPQLNTNNIDNIASMFSNCVKLTKIDITKFAKETTYNNSFASRCFSLTKLIIRTMDTIPSLNSNAFNGCYHFTGTVDATYNPEGLKDGRIYVPDDKVNELKTKTNWSIYADIIVPLSTLEE